jgi:hypothetical protein
MLSSGGSPTPLGKYKKQSLFGVKGSVSLETVVIAIPSRYGSIQVTPSPLRKVLRSICHDFLLIHQLIY